MKFRAKVSQMGDKFIIIIPAIYRKEAKPFKGSIVEVEMIKA
jgi:hypothetical protein